MRRRIEVQSSHHVLERAHSLRRSRSQKESRGGREDPKGARFHRVGERDERKRANKGRDPPMARSRTRLNISGRNALGWPYHAILIRIVSERSENPNRQYFQLDALYSICNIHRAGPD